MMATCVPPDKGPLAGLTEAMTGSDAVAATY
jgi:hypothetical protein